LPTIEIVSVKAPSETKLPQYNSFAYMADSTIESHRGLFQHKFDDLKGVMVHLANKELGEENDGDWFAGKLMDWNRDDDPLFFETQVIPDVFDLMHRLLNASPVATLTFSSDYQFGPPSVEEDSPLSMDRFWQLHDADKLRYNAFYRISNVL